jgi:O-antigen ligase
LASSVVLNSKPEQKGRLKQAAVAFFWLSAFYLVYCGRPEDWVPGMDFLPLAKITSAGAVIAFLFTSGKARRKLSELPTESFILLALIAVLLVASMFSPIWKGGAISRTLDFGKVWVVWVLTYLLVIDLDKFRRIVFIQAASVPLISLLSMVKGRHTLRLEGVLGGIYSNSNDLAFAIALSFPLCLMFLLSTRSKFRKLLWAGGMLAMGMALVQTASRGGLITFICTAVLCLWHYGVRGRRFYLIAITAVTGVVLLIVAGAPMIDRMSTLWGGNKGRHPVEEMRAEASLEQRQFLIDKAIEGIKEYPIFGIGTRNFEEYSTVWQEVHMTYLQVAVEGGIPSLMLFLVFFYYGFKNIRLIKKRKNLTPELKLFAGGLQSVLFGFGVGALFAPEAYQFFPYFAVVYTSALLAFVREQEKINSAALKPVPNQFTRSSPAYSNAGVPVNT